MAAGSRFRPLPWRWRVKPAAPAAFAYTNRRGDTYYLHEGKTKTGKPRYFFAKTVREGALTKMPEGFEVSESINGVVSARRKRLGEPTVPDEDLDVVQAAVKRQRRLQDHEVRVVGGAIVVFEPDTCREELRHLESVLGGPLPRSFIKDRMKKTRFAPVMKFEPDGKGYAVFRMTCRGEGDWSWPLTAGALKKLATKHVRHIGTDEVFELI